MTSARASMALVGFCLFAVKAAGAWKVLAMARAFGASDQLDAFLAAFLLPSFISEIVAGSLSPALIPVVIGAREDGGTEAMQRLIRSAAAALVALLCAASLLLLLVSPLALQALGAGYSDSKRALTQELLYLLLPVIPLSGLSIVWRAALNACDHFVVAALAPGFTPALCAVVLLLAPPMPSITMLAAATLAGLLLENITLAIAMRGAGLPVVPRWQGFDARLRAVGRQHLPLIAVAALGNASLLADQSAAAMLGPGSVSALNYGTRLALVLAGIAGGALGTVMLPGLARLSHAGQWMPLRALLRRYTGVVWAAAIPLAVAIAFATPTLVRILFVRGAFTEESAGLVAAVQRVSILQLPVLIANAMLYRALSSMQASSVLLRIVGAGFVLHATGDFVLSRMVGLPGIPAAGGIAQIVTLTACIWYIWRETGRMSKSLVDPMLRSTVL